MTKTLTVNWVREQALDPESVRGEIKLSADHEALQKENAVTFFNGSTRLVFVAFRGPISNRLVRRLVRHSAGPPGRRRKPEGPSARSIELLC
jgi:hypothetical protein